MRFEAVDVLGVPVHVVTEEDALEFARDAVEARRPVQIVTVNAEFVMMARWHRAFADALRHADLATPDSAGVVWAMRRRGAAVRRRVGGSDLIWSLSRQAAGRGHSVFLLGGEEGVAAQAAGALTSVYPALRVAGTYAGSPSPAEEDTIVDLVRASGADLLFVAFGAPGQDTWIARNLPRTGATVGMGVGGSFDYVAGRARRAPLWMQEQGLDWLWRLMRQPWRWRRMLVLPRFAWLVWKQGTGVKAAKG